MGRRICFFGGTFDPVHHGHLIVGRAVGEQCDFERVALVPTAQPPHKPLPAADPEHRLAMLREAISDEPIFQICDLELRRPPPSYTYDTLVQLRDRYGPRLPLHWVIGADMLEDFPKWHRLGEILDIAKIVIVSRPGWESSLEKTLGHLDGVLGRDAVDSLRKGLVSVPLIDISSTQIRRRINTRRSIRFLVPEKVRAYIEENHLYLAESPDGT